MDELKKKYNELLAKFNKAENYMRIYDLKGEKLATAILDREKHVPRLRELLQEMDILLKQIPHTTQEVWQGF